MSLMGGCLLQQKGAIDLSASGRVQFVNSLGELFCGHADLLFCPPHTSSTGAPPTGHSRNSAAIEPTLAFLVRASMSERRHVVATK
jgi:hypothetical protein